MTTRALSAAVTPPTPPSSNGRPRGHLRRFTPIEALDQLRLWAEARVGKRELERGGAGDLTIDFDASDRQRFHCVEHGTVVPLPGRYDCPYDMPYDPEADQRPRIVVIDRATGMVALNGS